MIRVCRGCCYYDERVECCDYLLMTGHRRPPGGQGDYCPVRVPIHKEPGLRRRKMEEAKAMALKGSRPPRAQEDRRQPEEAPTRRAGRPQKADWDRGMELYRQGQSDKEIGDTLGVCFTAVQHWRKRNGLPANHAQGSHKRKT